MYVGFEDIALNSNVSGALYLFYKLKKKTGPGSILEIWLRTYKYEKDYDPNSVVTAAKAEDIPIIPYSLELLFTTTGFCQVF